MACIDTNFKFPYHENIFDLMANLIKTQIYLAAVTINLFNEGLKALASPGNQAINKQQQILRVNKGFIGRFFTIWNLN